MSNPQNFTAMRLQFGELNITPRVEERLAELGYTPEELQEAVCEHKSGCDGEPSVYVGTYGKYNEGSLCGYQKFDIIKSLKYKHLIDSISFDNIPR